MRTPLFLLWLVALAGCRIETASPRPAEGAPGEGEHPRGEVWVYTSMYRPVLEALEPALKAELPEVTVRWTQGGSEKIAQRLEAELAAGATQADLLVTSDPFLYRRYKDEGRWLPYASSHVLRVPRALVDLDAAYAACRVSTLVLVHRQGTPSPRRFDALTAPEWRGAVALGDPLTSGTSFTWSVFSYRAHGEGYFQKLRANGAQLAGGNAAVLQKVESGEARVGVLLLENALAARARGSPIEIVYPEDGAVTVPGYVAIFRSSRNRVAARAVYDFLLSPRGQQLIVEAGDMHAADPRWSGPRGEPGLDALLERAQPWTDEVLETGVRDGERIKAAFRRAFLQ